LNGEIVAKIRKKSNPSPIHARREGCRFDSVCSGESVPARDAGVS
jgi:hypothetical protein